MNSIVIIEDHPVMRKGLAAWFAGTGRWQVLGIAAGLAEARKLFVELAAVPDILLLDIQLRAEDGGAEDAIGLDIIPWLRKRFGRTPPVVVYSRFDDYAHANAALSISLRTVENHLSRIYYKTGAASRADLRDWNRF